jgi:hypothetical protein
MIRAGPRWPDQLEGPALQPVEKRVKRRGCHAHLLQQPHQAAQQHLQQLVGLFRLKTPAPFLFNERRLLLTSFLVAVHEHSCLNNIGLIRKIAKPEHQIRHFLIVSVIFIVQWSGKPASRLVFFERKTYEKHHIPTMDDWAWAMTTLPEFHVVRGDFSGFCGRWPPCFENCLLFQPIFLNTIMVNNHCFFMWDHDYSMLGVF